MKVKIRRKNSQIQLPEYKTDGAAAFDLAASEDTTIEPKQIAFIKTGLYIQAPVGYFLAIFSRSSTPKKRGLTMPHGVGVLDSDYSGPEDEVLIMVYNFTQQPVEIKTGERIAQGIFLPTQRVQWEESEILNEKTRGGFGSSGIN